VETGSYVCLSVEDSGVGMAPEVAATIFDPSLTTKQTSGAELGLSTVYGIVKQNGGGIAVTTKQKVGTTFSVFFPRVASARGGAATPSAGPVARGSETTLLIDAQEPYAGSSPSCSAASANGGGHRRA
jgi:hypothetical protein